MKYCISLSGGLDSTCLLMDLLDAKNSDEKVEVQAYSFDYGQKQKIELTKVKKNIKFLQGKGFDVTHQIIDLKSVFSDSNSSLRRTDVDVPKGDYDNSNMTSTVVENRNVIFSSIVYGKALGWANKTGENVKIVLGIHAGDHFIYPDCRPESQEMARELFKISNIGSERVDYIAPFQNLTKAEVLEAGLNAMQYLFFDDDDINFILKNTHTCYDPDDKGRSCGECGSCKERLEAFAENGLVDPIKYK